MDPLDATAPGAGAPGEDKDPNKIDNVDLAYVFKSQRDNFPFKPYYDDGNPEMYTKENREKRASLKTNVIVKSAIENFAREQFERQGGKNPVITKEEYFKVFVKIGMILRPGIESDDLTRLIKEDFDNDSQDKSADADATKKEGEGDAAGAGKQQDFVTEAQLFDALFELSDIWCQNIDEYEYQGFFKQITFRLQYSGQQDQMAYDLVN